MAWDNDGNRIQADGMRYCPHSCLVVAKFGEVAIADKIDVGACIVFRMGQFP